MQRIRFIVRASYIRKEKQQLYSLNAWAGKAIFKIFLNLGISRIPNARVTINAVDA